MSKNRFIINEEQIQAQREAARAKNPNTARIATLKLKSKAISAEILSLMSDEEKYCNLMLAISKGFDSKIAAVKCMSIEELGEHASNLFYPYVENELDEAILNELLIRAGYKLEDE